MGTKHGEWFDLTKHLQIHTDVISDYNWLIKAGQNSYTVNSIDLGDSLEITHEIKFETHNGYGIEIFKRAQTSTEKPPKYGLTEMFRYNCFSKKSDYHLMYHSNHSEKYNPNAPWHLRPHRHEFDGKIQKLSVYSKDFRPAEERKRKYTLKDCPVDLTFLEHEDWPHVKEFLDEVGHLK